VTGIDGVSCFREPQQDEQRQEALPDTLAVSGVWVADFSGGEAHRRGAGPNNGREAWGATGPGGVGYGFLGR
jgi:hypothetical protein